MTLDEAIKYCEEAAEEKESEAQDLEYSKLDWRHEANQCSERAGEYRQLAGWLKELKQFKEQEPRDDAISRQAALEKAKDYGGQTYLIPVNSVKALPPVTPQQKTGAWINGNPICPCCGEDKFKDLDADIWADWQPKFCPNCGARMEKAEDEISE